MDESIGFFENFENDWICETCGKHFHEDWRSRNTIITGNQKKYPRFCSLECASQINQKDKQAILNQWLIGEDVSSSMSMSLGSVRYGDLTKFFWKKCRAILLKEQSEKCAICGITNVWNGNELIFILDHIDGDHTNQKKDNLRMICPNCNSQLETTKKRVEGKGRYSHRYLYYQAKNKMGLDNGNILSNEEWERRWALIREYNRLDPAWVSLAAKETGLSKSIIYSTCQHYGIRIDGKDPFVENFGLFDASQEFS